MEVVRREERTGHSMRGGEREREREAGAEQSGTIGHVKRVGRLEKRFRLACNLCTRHTRRYGHATHVQTAVNRQECPVSQRNRVCVCSLEERSQGQVTKGTVQCLWGGVGAQLRETRRNKGRD